MGMKLLSSSYVRFLFLIPALMGLGGLIDGAAGADWPATSGVEIGHLGEPGGLPANFEPSGAVWHPLRKKLIAVDDSGRVAEIDPAGGVTMTWDVGGDLEGITLVDPGTGLVYLAVENPDGVLEFDLDAGALTGQQWDLTPWLQGPNNAGLEALTYGEGHFYAGLQTNGNIFVFNLLPGGAVQYLETIAPVAGRGDISGLHFDACTSTLFAIHDSHDVIVEMSPSGALLREYNLAGNNQEGIALIGGTPAMLTTIFIAEDSGDVVRYEEYPVQGCATSSVEVGLLATPLSHLACRPNPFNPVTHVYFELASRQLVSVSIYDVQGKRIRTLARKMMAAGEHHLKWDGRTGGGRPLASGVYLARVEIGGLSHTTRMVLAR